LKLSVCLSKSVSDKHERGFSNNKIKKMKRGYITMYELSY